MHVPYNFMVIIYRLLAGMFLVDICLHIIYNSVYFMALPFIQKLRVLFPQGS